MRWIEWVICSDFNSWFTFGYINSFETAKTFGWLTLYSHLQDLPKIRSLLLLLSQSILKLYFLYVSIDFDTLNSLSKFRLSLRCCYCHCNWTTNKRLQMNDPCSLLLLRRSFSFSILLFLLVCSPHTASTNMCSCVARKWFILTFNVCWCVCASVYALWICWTLLSICEQSSRNEKNELKQVFR